MTHGPCLGEGVERSQSTCVGVGEEGSYQLPSSQCPCVKSGCTWANMQLVWGLCSGGGRRVGGQSCAHIQ